MPLRGRELTIEESLALCRSVGFTHERLITAVALMQPESGRRVEAYNINVKVAEDGTITKSIDRGLFQINSQHDKVIHPHDCYHATANARFAYLLSARGSDFTPWFAFKNGKHLPYMDEVRAVFEADEWRALVPTIQAELG